MNTTQYAAKTTGNVSSAVGIMAGVEYGAMLGTSVFPGIGTAVGAVAGAIVGDRVGRGLGTQVGSMLFQRGNGKNAMQSMTQKTNAQTKH